MSRDQLCDLWHGEFPSPDKKEGGEMLNMVIERTRSFDRRIAVRNTIECVAGLGVAGIFAWFAWRAPSLLERAGNAIVAASGLWIAFYIVRFGSGPRRLDPGVSLNAYNQLLRANYKQQIRLLRNVKYWYLLPPYVGILLANLGLGLRLHAAGTNLWSAVVSVATVTFVFVLVGIANEVYGVRHLKHLERELSSIEGSGL
jgi:hypothetical protein